ncbi:MAG: glycoside hydrolase family 3 N-terminal domain-containing protein [Actinomycetes bacterium]
MVPSTDMGRLRGILLALLLAAVATMATGALGCASQGVAGAAGESVAAATTVVSSPAPTTASSPSASSELAGWSNRRLAAQLVFCSVPATNPSAGRRFARLGVGGIVILGGGARSSIGSDLAAVLKAAPHGVKPFIASDEEGGQVQRLRDVVYPLPSARVQGGWSASKTRATAEDYGARLRKLHVSVVFGPVADLDVPGRYMSALDRCFSPEPKVVGTHVVAWVTGLRASRVLSTVKHWPGHGWATDTHSGAARVPSLSVLRRNDMVPFEQAFDVNVPLVMVGHLRAKGLTGDETPASLSRQALTYLRGRTGSATVIITDSLSMAATTKALGIKLPAAAVQALRAGADLALFATGDPVPVIDAVTAAIESGRIPRAEAEAKVLRILELKRKAGLAPAAQ